MIKPEQAGCLLAARKAGGGSGDLTSAALDLPLGRMAMAEEVAELVMCLLSGTVPYLNGMVIDLDAGSRFG